MKKIITILAAVLITASAFAQAPQKMSYQAVIRNTSNALVTSTPVGMRISILQFSPTGTAVYVETQTPSTNANGLVSLEIGIGTIVTGTFSSINWVAGPYFIKTETDPTGGTSYSITGTSQLLSVPYALHAKTAESVASETDPLFNVSIASGITATDTVNWNNDQTGNTILSFSKNINVGNAYISMDTVNLKAGKVVTIKGYVQTTGSECTVYLRDFNTGQWISTLYTVDCIYEDGTLGYNSYVMQAGGIVVPFSTTKKEFTAYFIPTSNLTLEVLVKELSATAGNGIGEAAVFVIQ